jgi:hypothetical protein
MGKIITKRLHERLDNFIYQNNDIKINDEVRENPPKAKKMIKGKSDGLIEKINVSNPVLIVEDNRELLTD